MFTTVRQELAGQPGDADQPGAPARGVRRARAAARLRAAASRSQPLSQLAQR